MSTQIDGCPFCNPSKHRIVLERRLALSILDAYPINPGHTLIIPKRHITSFFDLDKNELQDLKMLLESSKHDLDRCHQPDGFNVGFNDGIAAGQTVMHLHIHLIPRFNGDVSDPRGGIRWVIPDRAKYWK
jgi:diadenosine tetraphosphate (Ap4A) HIT family hydrolase